MVRAAWSETLGEDHPDTLAAANRLAGCLVGLRKYAEARDLFADLLPRCQRALGREDPLTLTVVSNLGGCLSALGAHEEARRQCEDIVRRSRLALGPDDPRTLRGIQSRDLPPTPRRSSGCPCHLGGHPAAVPARAG
ncbi:tetratricopeptide repeat protein [Streptomyces anthocyanicus]|uniref:tetratricopeptide repeat protein n=1 Tax=Streptomyces anthocyanicus TaxID=68174 RepID=UPI00369FAE4C